MTLCSLHATKTAPRTGLSLGKLKRSAAQTKPRDEFAVVLDVLTGDIVEQTATLADHQHQATAAVVVALVHLEMFSQVGDPLGEQSDLHIGRTGVTRLCGVLFDDPSGSLHGAPVAGAVGALPSPWPINGSCENLPPLLA